MLSGKRVTLRAMEREDTRREWEFNKSLQFQLDGGGDPPKPLSLAKFEADFEEGLKSDEHGFAIEADGKYIGGCALFHFNWQARNCEIGIGIGDPDYQSKGYGREAIGLLIDYGFRHRNLNRIWLTVNGNNERAIRAYQSCGFSEEGRLRQHIWIAGAYYDLVYMGLLRSEWEKIGERGSQIEDRK